jgi:hypothetical protein
MRLPFLAGVSLLTVLVPLGCAQPARPSAPWKPLFSGTSLESWYTYIDGQGLDQDPQGVFKFQDGVLHVYPDAPPGIRVPFGYVATRREYADFHLRLEYRWGTKKFPPRQDRARDAGVVYGCSGPDRVWPEGVECQIQEGDTGDLWALRTFVETTVDPNVPGPQARFLEAEAGGIVRTVGSLDKNTRVEKCCPNEIEGWNTVEVIVRGAASTHIVNGKVLFRSLRMLRSDPENPGQRVPIRRGKILLQAEGAEVFYRKVEIRELDPEAASRD